MFASCIMRVQLYVNVCNWMAAVCAAALLALAYQLSLPRLYSTLVRSLRKLRYIRNRPLPLPLLYIYTHTVEPFYGRYTDHSASRTLRTEGFCWCRVLLSACTCLRQLAHPDYGEAAGVFLSNVRSTQPSPRLT